MALRDVTWRLVYDKIRLRFSSNEFRFEDALETIFGKKKFNEREIKYASKLLNEIEDNAYAIHSRAEYDRRARLYRLLSPEKVSDARGIYQMLHQRGEGFTFDDLAREANSWKKWDYLYVKDSAIGFHTDYYRSIDVHHLSVLEDDTDGWIALLRFLGSQILVNDKVVHESDKGLVIHLHTDLESRKDQLSETKDYYQPAHYALVEALEDNDIPGALAIMIIKRNSLEWEKVIETARTSGVINTLGFCMECINKDAEKKVFNNSLIRKVEKFKSKRKESMGKKPELSVSVEIGYSSMEKKWNVECFQAASFRKAVLDLL